MQGGQESLSPCKQYSWKGQTCADSLVQQSYLEYLLLCARELTGFLGNRNIHQILLRNEHLLVFGQCWPLEALGEPWTSFNFGINLFLVVLGDHRGFPFLKLMPDSKFFRKAQRNYWQLQWSIFLIQLFNLNRPLVPMSCSLFTLSARNLGLNGGLWTVG